jgi:ATP-dependent DNA helicase DinG
LNTSDFFSEAVIEKIRNLIHETGGNEVGIIVRNNDNESETLVKLLSRGNRWSTPALIESCLRGDIFIHNHPSGILEPSDADVEISSVLASRGVASGILDNEAIRVYFLVEPGAFPEDVPVPMEEVINFFARDGKLAGIFQDYEDRPSQTHMAVDIAESLSNGGTMMIEAGTGTGKSLAYLVPSLLWARANSSRVIVSTATLNLQDQLLRKDIPILEAALGTPVKASVLKGRSNFLCLRKLQTLQREPELFTETEERDSLASITMWAHSTATGCRDELPTQPPPELWEKICSESDFCPGLRCPHNSSCWVTRSRLTAAASEIVFVNHHLLCADLSLRKATGTNRSMILPTYERLIIDEAHNLESTAAEHFGKSASHRGMVKQLGRVMNRRGNKGALPYLVKIISAACTGKGSVAKTAPANEIRSFMNRAVEIRNNLLESMDKLFTDLENFTGVGTASPEIADNGKFRLTLEVVKSPKWISGVAPAIDNFNRMSRNLRILKEDMTSWFRESSLQKNPNEKNRENSEIEDAFRMVNLYMRRFLDASEVLATMLTTGEGQEGSDVVWMEKQTAGKGRTGRIKVISCPIRVDAALRETLFSVIRTIVLTSATLTIRGSFEYMINCLGARIDGREVKISVHDSPFDYASQALILIPHDFPDPDSPDFLKRACIHGAELVTITEGRTLFLFTSYAMLKSARDMLTSELNRITSQMKDSSYEILWQGQDLRHRLIHRFKTSEKAILLGTDSFWEGVDIAGEALSMVIIMKLPFKSPGDPLIAARIDAVEKIGGKGFRDVLLPDGIIRFKQGFGRLIRNTRDKGTVAIFDVRITKKNYGRLFLESIPECLMSKASSDRNIDRTVSFFHD